MNTFQTIILAVFGFFIIAGLLVIATTKSKVGSEEVVATLWGSAPKDVIATLAEELFPKNFRLEYREIPEERFDQELLEALASGQGPDLVMLPLELLLRHRDKVYPIPYTSVSERDFKDQFIQAADPFLMAGGIVALPFSVDPLIMYWNRDMFDEAGITVPPKTWDEFLLLASKITARDRTGNVSRSAVALGEYRNIAHAKPILTTLLLQTGNPTVAFDSYGSPSVTLSNADSDSVIDFYTEFANPAKAVYSWNRSLPNSRAAFLKGTLAVYFGFGSELSGLRQDNPNLNFDAAIFPQPRGASASLTYGKLAGIAMLRTSPNISAALQGALTLSGVQGGLAWSQETGLPPVQRVLLANKPTDAFGRILYDSAIRSRGFLDPHPSESEKIFQTMIESVTSGKARTHEAVSRADNDLRAIAR